MALACRPWEFRVSCELGAGETACVVGSAPQLGAWNLNGAVELQTAETPTFRAIGAGNGVNGSSNGAGNGVSNGDAETAVPVSKASVTLRTDQDVHYRYCVCVILNADGQRKVVIRHWETDIVPRKLPASVLRDEAQGGQLDQFGRITPMRHVDRGWLNVESVVQLKLFNNPVELWKKRQRKYRLKVTPVNLEKKMMPEPMMSCEDSSEMDMQALRTGNTWPIMEIAVMKEGETSFKHQEQFGREYRAGEFFTFQCQMLKPETIRSRRAPYRRWRS